MQKNDVKSKTPLLPFALRKYPLDFKAVSDVVWTLAEACQTPAPAFACVSGTFKTFQKLANKKPQGLRRCGFDTFNLKIEL